MSGGALGLRILSNLCDRRRVRSTCRVHARDLLLTRASSGKSSRPPPPDLAGEEIIDRYALLVPAGTPAGDYTVQVGLYDWRTGVRLPLDAPGAPEHLILGTIRTVP